MHIWCSWGKETQKRKHTTKKTRIDSWGNRKIIICGKIIEEKKNTVHLVYLGKAF